MSCQPPIAYSNPRDLGEVQEPLRSRLWTAEQNAPRGGLILVSGKRTDYMQWLLRHERCPGRECDPGCKGHPVTARPGLSDHRNLSSAISAADMGGIDLQWLIDNRRSYGLALTVSSENWHFCANKRDVRTGLVHDNPTVKINRYGTNGNPNEGHHWKPFGPGDFDGVNGPIYKRGGYDNEVAEVQIRLKKLASRWKAPDLDPGTIDGIYGPASREAVSAFKRRIIKIQNDTGQTPWPNTDDKVGSRTIGMVRWWAN